MVDLHPSTGVQSLEQTTLNPGDWIEGMRGAGVSIIATVLFLWEMLVMQEAALGGDSSLHSFFLVLSISCSKKSYIKTLQYSGTDFSYWVFWAPYCKCCHQGDTVISSYSLVWDFMGQLYVYRYQFAIKSKQDTWWKVRHWGRENTDDLSDIFCSHEFKTIRRDRVQCLLQTACNGALIIWLSVRVWASHCIFPPFTPLLACVGD